MAKSADAADLKSAGRKAVGVQVPLWAPQKIIGLAGKQVTFTVAFFAAGAWSGACWSLLAILSTTDNL
jgi:hypothetical protein